MRLAKQGWDAWRKGGAYAFALRLSASSRLPSALFLMTETDILQLDRFNERALQRTPTGYEWVQGSADAIDGMLACSPEHERETLSRVFERFFGEGATCYLARHNGAVAAYVWAFSGRYMLTYDNYRRRNLSIRLDDASVFLGNGMIDAKHRLRGLFPHLMASVIRRWPPGTRFYSAVDRGNDHSLRSHSRLGFAPCLQVLCTTVLGCTCFFSRSADDESDWKYRSARQELTMPAPMLASSVEPK